MKSGNARDAAVRRAVEAAGAAGNSHVVASGGLVAYNLKAALRWFILLVSAVLPLSAVLKCGYYDTWLEVGQKGQAMLEFAHNTPIFVPSKEDVWRNYTVTMHSLIEWQRGMEAHYDTLASLKYVKAVTSNSLDFSINSRMAALRDNCRQEQCGTRTGCPAWIPTVIFGALVPLHFADSLPLALFMLQAATLDMIMALRVRMLADAVGAAVDELWHAELELALLEPRDDEVHEIVSQTLTILKVKAFRQRWETVDFGVAIVVPFINASATLRPSFVISLLAWALFRATEILLASSFPSAPRIGQWIYSAVRGDSDALHQHTRKMTRALSEVWRDTSVPGFRHEKPHLSQEPRAE